MSDGNRDADEGAAPTPEREPCPKCAAIHRTCHDSLPWERAPEPCPGLANATGSYHGHCHHRELYDTALARIHDLECQLADAIDTSNKHLSALLDIGQAMHERAR